MDMSIPNPIVNIKARRYRERNVFDSEEVVCLEEPLEIIINNEPYCLTMRLPGQDIALGLGLCFTEGLISSLKDVLIINFCVDAPNRLNVSLVPERYEAIEPTKKRRKIVQTACGICGKELILDICTDLSKSEKTLALELSQVFDMLNIMEEEQAIFSATGGTHMAGLFDSTGNLLAFAEDVGRHNALDKAIGKVLFAGKGGETKIVILSSRVSYEMIQKSARLGVEIVAGISAPTSLAVDLARKLGITLIGFLRRGRGATAYTFSERIIAD